MEKIGKNFTQKFWYLPTYIQQNSFHPDKDDSNFCSHRKTLPKIFEKFCILAE